MTKEPYDEIREKTFEILEQYYSNRQQWQGFTKTLEDIAFDQILSLETDDGYSLKEMIEFFSKIERETQRAAVVRREAELPDGVFDYKQHERIFREAGFVQEVTKHE